MTDSAWTIDQFPVPQVDDRDRFHDFALPPPMMHAIADLGFEYCTPIQSEVLPYSLADYDVTGQAQTGTGKTAAFLVTILAHQWERPKTPANPPGTPRALVLAPTRELAIQIEQDGRDLAKYLDTVVVSVVGGMDFNRQRLQLTEGPVDILVATPGRLLDFINRRVIDLSRVEILVIDEADRMLDMGFIPDVRRIVYKTPHKRERQTLFFSATFNEDVMRLASSWTLDPVHVQIEPENVAVDTVEQKFWLVSAENKGKLLAEMVEAKALSRVMVFANRRDSTRNLHEYLRKKNVSCEMLSGEVPQRKRLYDARQLQAGQNPRAGCNRRRRARHPRRRRQPRDQLRPAGGPGGLRPPHRPHRPRRRRAGSRSASSPKTTPSTSARSRNTSVIRSPAHSPSCRRGMTPRWQHHRTLLGWVLLAVSALCGGHAAAQARPFDYAIDPDGRLSIVDMLGADTWQQRLDAPTFGFRGDAVWLRASVPQSAEVLLLDNGWLDDVEVFFVSAGRVVTSYHTGNRFPFSTRGLHTAQFAFPVPHGDPVEHVYVRSIGHSSQYLPLTFMTAAAFQSQANTLALLQGCYYGIILAVILYYIVLYAGIRDRLYLYFVLYAGSLLLMLLSKDGIGPRYLWPDSPAMQRIALDQMTTLAIVFASAFSIEFLKLKRALPVIYRIVLGFVVVAAVNGMFGIAFVSHVFAMNHALLVMAATLLFVTAAVLRLMQGYTPALIYLLASGSLLARQHVVRRNAARMDRRQRDRAVSAFSSARQSN